MARRDRRSARRSLSGELLNSDVGKAAVAEFMLPGAGAAVLGAGGSSDAGADTPSRLGP